MQQKKSFYGKPTYVKSNKFKPAKKKLYTYALGDVFLLLLFIDMNCQYHNFQTYQGFLAATLLHY